MEHLRERFLKTYANTPINLRDEILSCKHKALEVVENMEKGNDSILKLDISAARRMVIEQAV